MFPIRIKRGNCDGAPNQKVYSPGETCCKRVLKYNIQSILWSCWHISMHSCCPIHYLLLINAMSKEKIVQCVRHFKEKGALRAVVRKAERSTGWRRIEKGEISDLEIQSNGSSVENRKKCLSLKLRWTCFKRIKERMCIVGGSNLLMWIPHIETILRHFFLSFEIFLFFEIFLPPTGALYIRHHTLWF